MIGHEKAAAANFIGGYNCAQSVFTAFCDVHGFDRETAARVSSSFGGGVGRLREICGALSGALMVLGCVEGGYEAGDIEAKAAHYRDIQEFARRFEKEIGSISCRSILGLPPGPSDPIPEAHSPQYLAMRPCLRCVETSARLLDEFLAEKGMKQA